MGKLVGLDVEWICTVPSAQTKASFLRRNGVIDKDELVTLLNKTNKGLRPVTLVSIWKCRAESVALAQHCKLHQLCSPDCFHEHSLRRLPFSL